MNKNSPYKGRHSSNKEYKKKNNYNLKIEKIVF